MLHFFLSLIFLCLSSVTQAFTQTAMQPLTGSEGHLLAMWELTKDFSQEFGRNYSFTFVGRTRSTLVPFGGEFDMAHATFPPTSAPLASLVYNPGFTDGTKLWGCAAKKTFTPVITFATSALSRSEYPSLIQFDSDDVLQGKAIATLFHQMGWERVAILKQDTPDVVDILQAFLDNAVNLQVVTHQTSGPPILKWDLDNAVYSGFELTQQCEQIKNSGAYIILLLAFDYNTADFLFSLRDYGLTEPPYQIVMNSHTVRVKVQFYPQLLPAPARTKTLWELARLLKGVAYISVGTPNYTSIAEIKQRWTQLALTKVHPELNTVPTFDLRMGFFQAVGYDSGIMTSRSVRELLRLQRDCGVCYTFNFGYNSTQQATVSDACWQNYLATNTTIQQSQFANQPPDVNDCRMLSYNVEGYTLYQIMRRQVFPSVAIPITRFDSKGVKIAPFSLAHGIDDDMEVVALQNDNGTFVLNDLSKPMVWRSGTTETPRDSDRLRIDEKLVTKLDASIIVLSFSIAFVSSWVASILIEQLIFYYMTRKGWIIWWVLATLSISVGAWASVMVGFTSWELSSSSGITMLTTTYSIVPFFTSILVIVPIFLTAFGVMFYHQRRVFVNETAVAAAKKNDSSSSSQLIKESESIFSPNNITRSLLGGVLMTSGTVGVHYVAFSGVDAPCTTQISAVGPVIGAFLGTILSGLGLLMFFHFRRSHYRYASNLFIAGTVTCVHFMSNMSVSWFYNGQALNAVNSNNLNRITVQLIASVSFAVLSFAFVILNVIRLRLSRDTFEAELKSLRQENERHIGEIDYLKRIRDKLELYLRILNVLRFPNEAQRSDHFIYEVLLYFKGVIEGTLDDQPGVHNLVKIDSEEYKNSRGSWRSAAVSTVMSSSNPTTQMANLISSAPKVETPSHHNVASSSSSSNVSSTTPHSPLIERKLQSPGKRRESAALPLKMIMLHPIFFEFIKDVSIVKSCDEMLAFVSEVQLFKRTAQSVRENPSTRINLSRIAINIYQTYLVEGASQLLNISSNSRTNVKNRMEDILKRANQVPSDAKSSAAFKYELPQQTNDNSSINENIFDEVESEMNRLISNNLWTSFVESPAYQTCLRLSTLLPTNIVQHDGSSMLSHDSYDTTSPDITQVVSVRTQSFG